MTTRYHKKKTKKPRHTHRYKLNKNTLHKNKMKTSEIGRGPSRSFKLKTQVANGDLIKAQVLDDSLNKEYYALDDYINNAYDEWEQWTKDISERLDHNKNNNHPYSPLFEEHDHG